MKMDLGEDGVVAGLVIALYQWVYQQIKYVGSYKRVFASLVYFKFYTRIFLVAYTDRKHIGTGTPGKFKQVDTFLKPI